MAHPFFDELQFPAYREEAKQLHVVLCIIYNTTAAANNIYMQCGPNLPGLTLANIQNTWHEALRNLAAASYLKTLCDNVKIGFPNNARVLEVINAIEVARPITAITIVDNGTLILDRQPVRNGIDKIASATAPAKVLLVRGDSKSGKSHVQTLFDLKARANGAESVYLFAENIPTLQKVVDQLFSLFGALQAPVVTDANTTDPAWNLDVCIKLQALAKAQEKTYWVAVDDLGEKDNAFLLPQTVRDFFDQLALQVKNPVFGNKFKLLYIHFPKKVPSKWTRAMYEPTEELKESDIKREDIEDALREWRDKSRKTLSDDKLTTAATKVLADAEQQYADAKAAAPDPNDVPSRLEFIHYRLLDEFATLEKN